MKSKKLVKHYLLKNWGERKGKFKNTYKIALSLVTFSRILKNSGKIKYKKGVAYLDYSLVK